MPIFIGDDFYWVDNSATIHLDVDVNEIKEHLKHVLYVLKGVTTVLDQGILCYTGDEFRDGTRIRYSLTEFGGKFLLLVAGDVTVMATVTDNLIHAIENLLEAM